MAVWRAALADPTTYETIGQNRHASPRRFVKGRLGLESAVEEPGDGRILVSVATAMWYSMLVDARVGLAATGHQAAEREAAAPGDPIGTAVKAARGGGLEMMFARHDAATWA